MTLLGKILTVLILVMSVMFAAFSIMVFATHRNWKMVVTNPGTTDPAHDDRYPTGLKFRLADLQVEKTNVERQLERLQNDLAMERAARRSALAGLEAKRKVSEEEVQRLTASLRDANAQLTQLTQSEKMAQDRLKGVIDEVAQLRDDVRNSQRDRDSYFKEVLALTDRVNETQSMIETLEERRTQLLAQLSDLKLTARRYEAVLVKNDLLAQVQDDPEISVDGVVLAITASNLIEISIGSDDGLRPGHQLDVYRANKYLGRVIVRQTQPNRAVAEIIKDLTRGTIQKGDRVDTRLSVG